MNRIVSKNECKELIQPAIDQSNKLYQASKILYDNEQYPISYSLFVLSMEEEAKAYICFLGSIGVLEIRKRHLYIHKNKQHFTGMLGMLFFIMNWEELPKIFDQSITDPNFQPATEKDIPKELNEKMSIFFDFIFSASELKEIGFYANLDESGKAIISDKEIDQETFPSFYFKNSSSISNDMEQNIMLSNFIQIQETFQKHFPPDLISKIYPIPADKIINLITTSASKTKE